MTDLMTLSEDIAAELTETQQENLTELLDDLKPIEGFSPQIILSLVSTRLGIDGARIKQNVGNDDLCPDDAVAGDIYLPGRVLARGDGDGVIVVPLFGWQGNQRWLEDDNFPDCFSNDCKTSGANGAACDGCPDEPWRNNEMQECSNIWNWLFLTEDCSAVFHVQFRGKSTKAGSILIRMTKNRPGTRLARLFSDVEKSGKNTYFVWKAAVLGTRPDKGLKKLGFHLGAVLKEKFDTILEEDQKVQGPSAADTGPVLDVKSDDKPIEEDM